MNEAEQKRFRFLCNESEVGKLEELRDFVHYCQKIQEENKDLEHQIKKLESQRKTYYSQWIEAWDVTGADWWGMMFGHVAILVAFIFAMIGAWHLVTPDPQRPDSILTNRYFLMHNTDRQIGACTQVMQEVLYGPSIPVSECFKVDTEALEYAQHLVSITGGTFKLEDTIPAEKPPKEQRDDQGK